MKKRKAGFTFAELLIVVAIIAVLVAISIPIFTNQLEKAREAVDLSNVRSAYGIVQTSIMTGTFPDGSESDEDGVFFVYTTFGNFRQYIPNTSFDSSIICKLKSKNADLSEFADVDFVPPNETTGWKDYAIMVYYDSADSVPTFYLYPSSYIQ